jgi:predicted RNase H-like nuclease (RuvC/YqgF family)
MGQFELLDKKAKIVMIPEEESRHFLEWLRKADLPEFSAEPSVNIYTT